MNETIKNNASRFGLLMAGISIAYLLVGYLIDTELLASFVGGLLVWVINIVILVIAVTRTRKELGGYIKFRGAFTTFIITYLIYALINTVFSIVLFSFIDPEVGEEIKETTIEKSVSMMEQFGASEEDIEAQVKQMEEADNYSLKSQVSGFFYGLLFFAVIGLIVAAATKKDPPPAMQEEDEENQSSE